MTYYPKFLTALFAFGLLVAMPAVSAPATLSGIAVDEVSLIGVSVFSVTDLEKVIEVAPGDRLERGKVLATAKNIQDLYRSAGYEAAKIETRLAQRTAKAGGSSENVLEVIVTEGNPTRIAEVSVEYDLPGWSDRLASATAKIGLKSGDLYDREKLLNGFRSMQDGLTSWDFLSPRVEESVVDQVSPPSTPGIAELIPKTARWVRVRVRVILGDRVSFSYRDNTIFPNGQLSSWIEEQRLLGFSQDYIERIRQRFEDECRKLGYDKVKVEVYTFEDRENQRRRVTYAFTEGPRVEIEKIEFDGNTVFTQQALLEQFASKSSASVSRGYFVAKDVDQTAALVVEWMKSQGYLTAKLVSISKNYRPNGARVDLVIYVYEGEQTVTDSVRFEGLSVFPKADLEKLLGNSAGKPLDLYTLNIGLEKIKLGYRERGYLDIKIANESTSRLVLYSQENRVAEIVIDLQEGVQYRVTRIDVEGLRKTQIETVRRELELKEGDVLSERIWSRSEAKLRRLGIFATASIKAFPDPDRKDGKILKITVEEGSPGLIAGGVGLRNDLGVRGFGQIQYANILGKNHTLAFTAALNRRYPNLGGSFCPSDKQQAEAPNEDHCFIEFNGTVGYVWPWFAPLGETTFRPRVSVERNQFKNFDADTYMIQASWDRFLNREWGLSGVFNYSLELIEQKHANDPDDERQLRIGSISPTLILDRRDNALAPRKGTYTTFQFDWAQPIFGSQNGQPEGGVIPPDSTIAYWRAQFRNDIYIPLTKEIDVFLSIRAGSEYNQATPPPGFSDAALRSQYSIPLIKQYTLGGVGSLRGFGEQSLNAQNQNIRGTLNYVNYRAQVDVPFAGAMKFGPFIDAGNLNIDHYLGELRYGVGAGFHYKSPVGPVNFDIGINPDPRPGEDDYKLHFSIGTI